MPAEIQIALSRAEKESLRRQRRSAPNLRVWNRATALLLLASRIAASDILKSLGVSQRTLFNWKQRWLKRRQFGLDDAPRRGRPPHVTASFMRWLLNAVRQDPRRWGYAFTRWTAPRLSEFLDERTGIRVTPAWISELLRRNGFVWRKTKRTLRNLQDPEVTKRAWRAIKRLKKGLWLKEPATSFGSVTESASNSFRLPPTRIGSEVALFTSQRRERTPK